MNVKSSEYSLYMKLDTYWIFQICTSITLKLQVTVYCNICDQRIDQKAFLNWLCQYLSFLYIFSKDFAQGISVELPQIQYIMIH